MITSIFICIRKCKIYNTQWHSKNPQTIFQQQWSATKIEQHTLPGIDSPVLHTWATTDSDITIQPALWQVLIWFHSHTVPIITLTLRAKRPCFLHLPEEVGSKSMPDNLLRAMWWHATFSCVIVFCLLNFPRWHVYTHAHTLNTHKLADGGGRKGHVWRSGLWLQK